MKISPLGRHGICIQAAPLFEPKKASRNGFAFISKFKGAFLFTVKVDGACIHQHLPQYHLSQDISPLSDAGHPTTPGPLVHPRQYSMHHNAYSHNSAAQPFYSLTSVARYFFSNLSGSAVKKKHSSTWMVFNGKQRSAQTDTQR